MFRPLAVLASAVVFCTVASAHVSGTKTLTAATSLNLDTGNTSASGGDLLR